MTGKTFFITFARFGLFISETACKKDSPSADGAPPAPVGVPSGDMSSVFVDKPEQFSIVAVQSMDASMELNVTGSIFPDISREVPVITLANGRVVNLTTRPDDNVKKGQFLFSVESPDVSDAFNVYLKAANDERMDNTAYARAQELYDHGAISKATFERAEDAEKDTKADLSAAEEQLTIYGVDKDPPKSVVDVYSPSSGVVVAQNVTDPAAAGINLSGSATAFTVADLSTVWAICDFYESDIAKLLLGQEAKIKVNAYPDRLLTGHFSDIDPVLDPSIRTAKVRIEPANPGMLKLGMFVTATFESRTRDTYSVAPANPVLHLHDRDRVFVPAGGKQFRRIEVTAGRTLSDNRQLWRADIAPGEQVAFSALLLAAAGSQ